MDSLYEEAANLTASEDESSDDLDSDGELPTEKAAACLKPVAKEVPEVTPKAGGKTIDVVACDNTVEFNYKREKVHDLGSVCDPEFLDITDEDIKAKFMVGVTNVAALSLAISYPTIASVSHSVVIGMRNLLAVAAITKNDGYGQKKDQNCRFEANKICELEKLGGKMLEHGWNTEDDKVYCKLIANLQDMKKALRTGPDLDNLDWSFEPDRGPDLTMDTFDNLDSDQFTRKKILSLLNSFFDPIELISACLSKFKIFMREVTAYPDLDWDIPLPAHFQEIWRGWVTERVATEITRRQSSNILSSMNNDDISRLEVCKKELCKNLDLNARHLLALQPLRKHSVPLPGTDSQVTRQS